MLRLWAAAVGAGPWAAALPQAEVAHKVMRRGRAGRQGVKDLFGFFSPLINIKKKKKKSTADGTGGALRRYPFPSPSSQHPLLCLLFRDERSFPAPPRQATKMVAAAAPVPPVLCKRGQQQQLVLAYTTKPPLPLRLTRRAVSVRAAPPRQRQQRQHHARPRPPPRNKPPGPARRPPRVPLDQDEYDDGGRYDDREEGRFAGGTRAAAMPKPPAGFVLDDQGRCIAAASKRIVTIVRLPIPLLHSLSFCTFDMLGFS